MIWDLHTYLMVDPHIIDGDTALDCGEGTSLVREEAFKRSEGPIARNDDDALTLGGRAKGLQNRLVIKQDGVYRLWYAAWLGPATTAKLGVGKSAPVGYAESDDGIDFHPVNLNQVELDGSRDNNLIDFTGDGQIGAYVTSILHDPLDSTYPFKCIYYRRCPGTQLEPELLARFPDLAKREWDLPWGVGRSRDGLRWEPPQRDRPLIGASIEEALLHRDMEGRLIASNQMMSPTGEIGGRHVKGWIISDDLESSQRIPDYLFRLPEHVCRVSTTMGGTHEWDGTHWVQPHIGLAPARKGPSMIALHGYLYGAMGAETFAQVADTGLAVSRTGVGFREVWPFRPFIPRGPRGSWDFGMVAQRGILDDGDESRFYYIGNDVGNLGGNYQIGLAHIPRDRYGYRVIRGHRDTAPRDRTARFTLRSMTLPDRPELAVNVSHVSDGREVRAQLADDSGQPIPGFTFEKCDAVIRPGLRQPLRWEGADVEKLRDQTVQISVQMTSRQCGFMADDSPRVYAIYASR